MFSEEVCIITKSMDFKSKYPEFKTWLDFTVLVSTCVMDTIIAIPDYCED